jgi:hypothetical protein
MALIAQAATLEARVPFLHFFDGFRTSHEVNKTDPADRRRDPGDDPDDLVLAHRARALNPDRPFIRGTAQNPDTYFQSRETVNPFYAKVPGIVQAAMDKFAGITGRRYNLFDYFGDPAAERVIVIMGSGAEAACETAAYLNQRGEKVGVLAGAPVPAPCRPAFPGGIAHQRQVHCGAGSHQGAGRDWRADVSWMWSTPCSKRRRPGSFADGPIPRCRG